MNLRPIFAACLLSLAFTGICLGQTNDILLRSELENARTDLADRQFRSAVRHLDEAKKLLKSTTPEIQAMLVNGYVGLAYYDDARRELEAYFNTANEQSPYYVDMVRMVSKITDLENQHVVQGAKEEKTKAEEEALWAKVKLSKNSADINEYLQKYPAGTYAMPARNYLNMQKEYATEKVIAEQYKAKWQRRKKARTGFLVTGLILTAAGTAVSVMNQDYYDDYYSYSYVDSNKYTWYSIGNYSAAAGTTSILTAIIINSRKHKRNYHKQLDKLQVLENQMISGLN